MPKLFSNNHFIHLQYITPSPHTITPPPSLYRVFDLAQRHHCTAPVKKHHTNYCAAYDRSCSPLQACGRIPPGFVLWLLPIPSGTGHLLRPVFELVLEVCRNAPVYFFHTRPVHSLGCGILHPALANSDKTRTNLMVSVVNSDNPRINSMDSCGNFCRPHTHPMDLNSNSENPYPFPMDLLVCIYSDCLLSYHIGHRRSTDCHFLLQKIRVRNPYHCRSCSHCTLGLHSSVEVFAVLVLGHQGSLHIFDSTIVANNYLVDPMWLV